jgi:hypothetical protein
VGPVELNPVRMSSIVSGTDAVALFAPAIAAIAI